MIKKVRKVWLIKEGKKTKPTVRGFTE
jgi:hypothetical protein